MKKCILINSPIFWDAVAEGENYLSPLGLGYIATYVEKAGIQVEILDAVKQRKSVEDIVKYIEEKQPDCVGLANVGAEEHKGTELYRNTHELLQNSKLNFIGNVEGRDIPNGVCDVVVCDGFTGNLILKTYEGVALVMMKQIKNMFMGSVKGKLAAGLVMKDLKNMKTHFDYNRYGGAPILGASKPVFKAHGSAKAVTVKNAIRLSVEYVKANAIEAISSSL